MNLLVSLSLSENNRLRAVHDEASRFPTDFQFLIFILPIISLVSLFSSSFFFSFILFVCPPRMNSLMHRAETRIETRIHLVYMYTPGAVSLL